MVGKIVCSVKQRPWKRKDLSSAPRTHVKELGVVVHTCNPIPGKAEPGRPLGPYLVRSRSARDSGAMERDPGSHHEEGESDHASKDGAAGRRGTRDKVKGFVGEWLGWRFPTFLCATDLIVCAVIPAVLFSV